MLLPPRLPKGGIAAIHERFSVFVIDPFPPGGVVGNSSFPLSPPLLLRRSRLLLGSGQRQSRNGPVARLDANPRPTPPMVAGGPVRHVRPLGRLFRSRRHVARASGQRLRRAHPADAENPDPGLSRTS